MVGFKNKKPRLSNNLIKGDSDMKRYDAEQEFDINEFKELLKDPQKAFLGLEKIDHFIGTKDGEDIINLFCKSLNDASMIIKLTDGLNIRKKDEICQIFSFLDKILINCSSSKEIITKSIGNSVAHNIIQNHLSIINNLLNYQDNRKTHVICALKLLTAIVMQNSYMAKELISQIDLFQQHIENLLINKQNINNTELRNPLIQFFVSFFVIGDIEVIRQITSKKDILSLVFPTLLNDTSLNIIMVLSVLHEKLVKRVEISKTLKIKLFGTKSLTYLGLLYHWNTGTNLKISYGFDGFPKLVDEATTLVEDETTRAVRGTVHELMTDLLTSYKYGIIFGDKLLGFSGRNMNHVITNFLQNFPTPFASPRCTDLVSKIVNSCPDQFIPYLNTLQSMLEPKPTLKYLKCATFVNQLYTQIPLPHTLFTPMLLSLRQELLKETNPHQSIDANHGSSDKCLEILLEFTAPGLLRRHYLTQALSSQHPFVCYRALRFLISCLDRVRDVSALIAHHFSLDSHEAYYGKYDSNILERGDDQSEGGSGGEFYHVLASVPPFGAKPFGERLLESYTTRLCQILPDLTTVMHTIKAYFIDNRDIQPLTIFQKYTVEFTELDVTLGDVIRVSLQTIDRYSHRLRPAFVRDIVAQKKWRQFVYLIQRMTSTLAAATSPVVMGTVAVDASGPLKFVCDTCPLILNILDGSGCFEANFIASLIPVSDHTHRSDDSNILPNPSPRDRRRSHEIVKLFDVVLTLAYRVTLLLSTSAESSSKDSEKSSASTSTRTLLDRTVRFVLDKINLTTPPPPLQLDSARCTLKYDDIALFLSALSLTNADSIDNFGLGERAIKLALVPALIDTLYASVELALSGTGADMTPGGTRCSGTITFYRSLYRRTNKLVRPGPQRGHEKACDGGGGRESQPLHVTDAETVIGKGKEDPKKLEFKSGSKGSHIKTVSADGSQKNMAAQSLATTFRSYFTNGIAMQNYVSWSDMASIFTQPDPKKGLLQRDDLGEDLADGLFGGSGECISRSYFDSFSSDSPTLLELTQGYSSSYASTETYLRKIQDPNEHGGDGERAWSLLVFVMSQNILLLGDTNLVQERMAEFCGKGSLNHVGVAPYYGWICVIDKLCQLYQRSPIPEQTVDLTKHFYPALTFAFSMLTRSFPTRTGSHEDVNFDPDTVLYSAFYQYWYSHIDEYYEVDKGLPESSLINSLTQHILPLLSKHFHSLFGRLYGPVVDTVSFAPTSGALLTLADKLTCTALRTGACHDERSGPGVGRNNAVEGLFKGAVRAIVLAVSEKSHSNIEITDDKNGAIVGSEEEPIRRNLKSDDSFVIFLRGYVTMVTRHIEIRLDTCEETIVSEILKYLTSSAGILADLGPTLGEERTAIQNRLSELALRTLNHVTFDQVTALPSPVSNNLLRTRDRLVLGHLVDLWSLLGPVPLVDVIREVHVASLSRFYLALSREALEGDADNVKSNNLDIKASSLYGCKELVEHLLYRTMVERLADIPTISDSNALSAIISTAVSEAGYFEIDDRGSLQTDGSQFSTLFVSLCDLASIFLRAMYVTANKSHIPESITSLLRFVIKGNDNSWLNGGPSSHSITQFMLYIVRLVLVDETGQGDAILESFGDYLHRLTVRLVERGSGEVSIITSPHQTLASIIRGTLEILTLEGTVPPSVLFGKIHQRHTFVYKIFESARRYLLKIVIPTVLPSCFADSSNSRLCDLEGALIDTLIDYDPYLSAFSGYAKANKFNSDGTLRSVVSNGGWMTFVKALLKYRYISARHLSLLAKLCSAYYGDGIGGSDDVAKLVLYHSSFFGALIDDVPQEQPTTTDPTDHRQVKGSSTKLESVPRERLKSELLNLLCVLGPLCSAGSGGRSSLSALINDASPDPSSKRNPFVPVLLAAYQPYQRCVSLAILKLLKILSDEGYDLTRYKPYFWGPRAISHFSLLSNQPTASLWNQTSQTDDVLDSFDPLHMSESAKHFPLHRSLDGDLARGHGTGDSFASTHVYDPRFVLPLLYHLTSTENLMSLQKFASAGCFPYLISALSSHYLDVRKLAIAVLDNVYQHLVTPYGQKFKPKQQVTFLMELLKNSLDESTKRLPSITVAFISEAFLILMNPGHLLFKSFLRTLLVKPYIDTNDIPAFSRTFFSWTDAHENERNCLLNILHRGLREYSDYKLLRRHGHLEVLMTYYGFGVGTLAYEKTDGTGEGRPQLPLNNAFNGSNSSYAPNITLLNSNQLVLKILIRATHIAWYSMVQDVPFLLWLSQRFAERRSKAEKKLLLDILYNLCQPLYSQNFPISNSRTHHPSKGAQLDEADDRRPGSSTKPLHLSRHAFHILRDASVKAFDNIELTEGTCLRFSTIFSRLILTSTRFTGSQHSRTSPTITDISLRFNRCLVTWFYASSCQKNNTADSSYGVAKDLKMTFQNLGDDLISPPRNTAVPSSQYPAIFNEPSTRLIVSNTDEDEMMSLRMLEIALNFMLSDHHTREAVSFSAILDQGPSIDVKEWKIRTFWNLIITIRLCSSHFSYLSTRPKSDLDLGRMLLEGSLIGLESELFKKLLKQLHKPKVDKTTATSEELHSSSIYKSLLQDEIRFFIQCLPLPNINKNFNYLKSLYQPNGLFRILKKLYDCLI